MTTIRKEWIDCLKGFAIFLVVMGHVLTWQQYDNFYEIVNQPGSSRILGLWYVIYSFHMPLFMFCSGLVFYKKADYYSLANFFSSVKKSFSRLMIPYFIMGGALAYISGKFAGYWYLFALFLFSLVVNVPNFILSKFQKWNSWGNVVFFWIYRFITSRIIC